MIRLKRRHIVEEKGYTLSGSQVSGLCREPSFSCWYNEDNNVHLRGPESLV